MDSDVILEDFKGFIGDGPLKHGEGGNEYFTYKLGDEFGVFVECPASPEPLSESFASLEIRTGNLSFGGACYCDLVILSCVDIDKLRPFAALCANFVDPGKDGSDRRILTTQPIKWWMRWKTMVGNVCATKKSYGVLGEMFVMEYMHMDGQNPRWEGPSGGVDDIVGDMYDAEVKSTVRRYSYVVDIAGQYQIDPSKVMWLFFCRFERSESGTNIDEMSERLVSEGVIAKVDADRLLAMQDFGIGKAARKDRYRLMQMVRYPVTPEFPDVKASMFKNGKLPKGVTHISFEVDLDAVDGGEEIDVSRMNPARHGSRWRSP